jgi:hypothetical protein
MRMGPVMALPFGELHYSASGERDTA